MYETRDNGGKVAFSLSDSFCVQRHLEEFKEIVAEKVDIVFGNEKEIVELYEISSIDEANLTLLQNALELSNLSVIVITRHDKGCIVVTHNEVIPVDAEAVKAVDSTGAGDAFAAGFLYGLQQGFSYYEAASIANNVAAQVVRHIGARPDINLPKNIKEIKSVA